MKSLVYIESSIISYLASKPSNDLISAARQSITHAWWENCRNKFDLSVSALVEDEIKSGNPDAAQKRLAYVQDLPYLDVSEKATQIADELLAKKVVPKGSEEDALHIGITAAHGVDYLLTWNFKHINNAVMKQKIQQVIEDMGYQCPQLCSPEELGGMNDA
jgi:hypothetical protein